MSSGNVTGAVNIFKRGSGNTGWSKIKFRFNDKPWRYGDAGYDGTGLTNYDVELNRTDADAFAQVDGTYYNSNYAYGWRFVWTGYTGSSDLGKIAGIKIIV